MAFADEIVVDRNYIFGVIAPVLKSENVICNGRFG